METGAIGRDIPRDRQRSKLRLFRCGLPSRGDQIAAMSPQGTSATDTQALSFQWIEGRIVPERLIE